MFEGTFTFQYALKLQIAKDYMYVRDKVFLCLEFKVINRT